MLLSVVLLLGYFELSIGGNCPSGSVDYIEAGECILTIPAVAPFSTASRTCGALNGRLMQPQTQQENLLAVVSARRALSTQVPVTIGVIQKNFSDKRIYADGTPLQYINFFSESEYSSSDPCTVLNPTTLQWYSTPCNDTHPFVCQFSDLNPDTLCPVGWSYNDFTNNCYYVQKVIASNKALSVNQSAAEALCIQMGAHLASIHTERENIWIRNLISTWGGVDCSGGQALIGASCKDGKKAWTDGSTFSYDLTNGQCTDAYTMINDYHCGGDLRQIWPSWYAQNEFSSFICQKAALRLTDVALNILKSLP